MEEFYYNDLPYYDELIDELKESLKKINQERSS